MKKLRLLLVDDHAVVREGLRLLLSDSSRFDVVADVADGGAALAVVERLQPDLVVLDLSLPGMTGAELTRRMRALFPAIRIIAFTVHDEGGYLQSLLDAGASGYVLKRSPASELLRAIEVVAAGGVFLDASIARQMLNAGPRTVHVHTNATLSEREREVVYYVAHGYSNKEIGQKLAVSVKTVETYRFRASEKLGLHSRAELVRYAIDQGWLAGAPAGV